MVLLHSSAEQSLPDSRKIFLGRSRCGKRFLAFGLGTFFFVYVSRSLVGDLTFVAVVLADVAGSVVPHDEGLKTIVALLTTNLGSFGQRLTSKYLGSDL
jgi:hypothetical protein